MTSTLRCTTVVKVQPKLGINHAKFTAPPRSFDLGNHAFGGAPAERPQHTELALAGAQAIINCKPSQPCGILRTGEMTRTARFKPAERRHLTLIPPCLIECNEGIAAHLWGPVHEATDAGKFGRTTSRQRAGTKRGQHQQLGVFSRNRGHPATRKLGTIHHREGRNSWKNDITPSRKQHRQLERRV